MNANVMIRHFGAKHIGAFSAALTLSVVTLAAGIALLGVSGWFLTGAALTTAGIAFNLFGPSALVRGLSLIRIVSRYGEKLVGHDATLRLLSDLRGWLFRRLIPRVPFPSRQWRRGDLVSRLTSDIDALDTVFLTAIGPILTALLSGLVMTAILGAFLPTAVVTYIAGFGTVVLALPLVLIWMGKAPGEASTLASSNLRLQVLDGIEGHADLRAFGIENKAFNALDQTARLLSRMRMKQSAINSLGIAVVQVAGGVTLAGTLWQGLEAYEQGSIEGPLLVGLLLAIVASFEAATSLARNASRLGAALSSARRVQNLASSEISIQDPAHPALLPAGNTISFKHVQFGYKASRPVLKNLDLDVASGERLAIIGPSGCGKSTILHLLLRLEDVHSGTISLAGKDIRSVSQVDLHKRVALLSQNTPVFLGTIRDNLRIGNPDANEAAYWKALQAACLDSFARSLPDGLDTWLGEAGRTLSAGQMRRLCLARVLLSPASVIALDEPTSGLDRETEEAFLADLASATKGRTLILVTHANLPAGAVERILRLESGRLIEDQ